MVLEKELIGLIGAALVLCAYVPYIIKILKNKVKPQPFTWLTWCATSVVICLLQISNGSGSGAYTTAVVAFFCATIFLLSVFKYRPKVQLLDIICLVASTVGILVWLVVDQPAVSIVIMLGVEMIGSIPTFRKAWTQPYEDSVLLWAINTARQVLSFSAIQHYTFVTVLNPIMWTVLSLGLCTLLLARRRNMRKPWRRKRTFTPYN